MIPHQQQDINYRQMGKLKTGKLLKGNSIKLTSVKTIPTIPPKYETILNTSVKYENNAFTTSSNRFKNIESDNPGPGKYLSHDTFIKINDSISKKGLGNGFVSKTSRFNIDYEKINKPSPGSYNPADLKNKHVYSERGTSAFLNRRETIQKTNPLGPGNYEIKDSSEVHVPIFKSQGPRFITTAPSINVAPGDYSPQFLRTDINGGVMLKSRSSRILNTSRSNLLDIGPGQYNIIDTPKSPTSRLGSFNSTQSRFIKSSNIENEVGPGTYDLSTLLKYYSILFFR